MEQTGFDIAGFVTMPGTRNQGWLDVARAPAGGSFGIPLIVAHGTQPGPVVLIEACAHGDEYEGTLSLLTFMDALDPGALRGTVLAVPVLNGPAFEAETRGSPLERYHYDLNRTFPGEPGGSLTQRITAKYFSQVVKRATTVISLHGGGNVFYLDGFVVAHAARGDALELIRAFGWARFTDSPDIALNPYQGTLWGKCHEFGITTIVAEFGGACRRAPEDLARAKRAFHQGIRNVLIHHDMITGTAERAPVLERIKKQNLRAAHGGIIDIAAGIDIDADVAKDQTLMTVYDPLGNVTEVIRAPFDGRIMAIPASPLAYPGRILTSVYSVVERL